MQIDFTSEAKLKFQNALNSAVVPRPIGLISTVDDTGTSNLAPFSFFNMVSYDPAIVIFSPVRRLRDKTQKHTVLNIREIPEVVIHIVSYSMVQQMNLTACEYGQTVDEFERAGFTKEKAIKVKPWMIKECLVKLECKVKEMRSMGTNGGAGMVCFAEVVCMHVDDSIIDINGYIDPVKLSPIARLGGDYYSKITSSNLFTMPKPNRRLGIGFDLLPQHILDSKVLSANQLGLLAQSSFVPSLDFSFTNVAMQWNMENELGEKQIKELHKIAARMLDLNCIDEAWQVLLRSDGYCDLGEGACSNITENLVETRLV